MTTTSYMIKSFEVLSVAKFCGILGLIWGAVAGIFLAAGISGMGQMMGFHALGIGAGIVGLIFMIIIGGIGGFIAGAVGAIIYNAVLGVIGGVGMELEVKE
jgi:hypothetical protein